MGDTLSCCGKRKQEADYCAIVRSGPVPEDVSIAWLWQHHANSILIVQFPAVGIILRFWNYDARVRSRAGAINNVIFEEGKSQSTQPTKMPRGSPILYIQ